MVPLPWASTALAVTTAVWPKLSVWVRPTDTTSPGCGTAPTVPFATTSSWGPSGLYLALIEVVVAHEVPTVGRVGAHAPGEVHPAHRELHAFPFELAPGTGKEEDNVVTAALRRTWTARHQTVPGGTEDLRSGGVSGIASATLPPAGRLNASRSRGSRPARGDQSAQAARSHRRP